MHLIPVVDILAGRAVHAVGGRRHAYKPVVSRLTASTAPDDVAAAMLDAVGGPSLYVADLDAISGTGSNADWVTRIAERKGAVVYADVGLNGIGQSPPAIAGGLSGRATVFPVWGSETITQPAALPRQFFSAFSVDLHAGKLFGEWAAWHTDGVTHDEAVAEMAAAGQARTGARLVILLDLHSVGRREGPAALAHCRAVRHALPAGVSLAIGGGVRNRDDLAQLADAGADAALVATAVHTGALP